MGRKCQVTGKIPATGRSYALRGIAKKKKGIGLKITGIKKRRFLPNLVKKRLWLAEEQKFVTLSVSTAGLRTIDKQGLAAVVHRLRKEGQKI